MVWLLCCSVFALCCCTWVQPGAWLCHCISSAAEFFEECIEEERYAAEKLTIMKEAIHAQPQYKKSVGGVPELNDGPASPEPLEDGAPLNGH